MATYGPEPDTGEASVTGNVVGRVAERVGADPQAVANVLVTLHAELIGRHAHFERRYEYVTIDGTRAYRVDNEEWDELLESFDVEAELAEAAQRAHTHQAGLLFAQAVGVDDQFAEDEAGVVIGIDTAEQF
jgi:hypothetical protein